MQVYEFQEDQKIIPPNGAVSSILLVKDDPMASTGRDANGSDQGSSESSAIHDATSHASKTQDRVRTLMSFSRIASIQWENLDQIGRRCGKTMRARVAEELKRTSNLGDAVRKVLSAQCTQGLQSHDQVMDSFMDSQPDGSRWTKS